jgi:hypothetical protein
VLGGDPGLQHIARSHRSERSTQRRMHEQHPGLLDLIAVPQRAVLIGQQNQVVVRAHAGVSP